MMGNTKQDRAQKRYDGLLTKRVKPQPKLALPQDVSQEELQSRQYDMSLQRLKYNYMRTYPSLENVPVSAELPEEEMYDERYDKLVSDSQTHISHNFQTIVFKMIQKQLTDNFTNANLSAFRETGNLLKNENGLLDFFKDVTKITSSLPALVQTAADSLSNYPPDITKMFQAALKVQEQTKIEGPTAYLKSTLYDMLANNKGRDYLQATSLQDYKDLHQQLPTPLMLSLPKKPWMKDDSMPCEQDWFFAQLQVAGFNTTMIVGVTEFETEQKQAMSLQQLQEKMPITDTQFQRIVGDSSINLADAARLKRLYVCDYKDFDGLKAIKHHGKQRYINAPIAIFYWDPEPPFGYQQDGQGALRPVAIQCGQNFDPIENPIFSPNDACNADDSNGLKWQIAKFIVNAACAMHHESIAHFGMCHLTVEPAVLATHRQLSNRHPLHKLLMPHFRFNININDDARHKLIAPGGVIATNVGPAIDETLGLVRRARLNWRFDDNRPDRLFESRAIDQSALPLFPFRDDTLLLWEAIHEYIGNYIRYYYKNDQCVINDSELQEWIHEMTSPLYAHFQGMEGLVETGNPDRPYRIESLDYLIEVIAYLVYLAGPQHANANYAQYPFMSYMPCVAGTVYHPAPTRMTKLESQDDQLKWYPPLDVALYTFSFEYLLSTIQYDKLGYYDENLREHYFDDENVREIVADFQEQLALAEMKIRKANRSRPYAYTFQMPSKIPNSISI